MPWSSRRRLSSTYVGPFQISSSDDFARSPTSTRMNGQKKTLPEKPTRACRNGYRHRPSSFAPRRVVVVDQLRMDLGAVVEQDVVLPALLGERRDLLLDARDVQTRIGSDERRDHRRIIGANHPDGLVDFLRGAEHQVIQADGVDAKLTRHVDHLVERLEALLRDGGVDADAKRCVLAPRRVLQATKPGTGALERAGQPARPIVQLAGAVDRHADVLQEARRRQIGQRFGPFLVDDRPVRRQVAARVPLLLEEVQHRHDVLAHEDLAAGEADLEPGLIREGLPQPLDRHLLAPLAFDVEEVDDVAELAVQVAPHGGFVDGANRQPVGAAILVAKKASDPVLVPTPPVTRPGMPRQRDGARARRDRLAKFGDRFGSLTCQGHSVARSPVVDRDARVRRQPGHRCCAGMDRSAPARPR